MENFEDDILQNTKELKEMPFSVPDGYFDRLKSEVRECTKPQIVHVGIWTKLAPYAAIAAMFLFILTLGKLFVGQDKEHNDASVSEDVSTYEDFLVFNDSSIDLTIHYLESESDETAYLDNDDIIEYLIYTGVSEQYIEYNKK